MKKLWNIACGWWFWITNRNNKLAQERLAICANCSFRKWFICGECGCPLQAKSRLPEEKCPLGMWENPPTFKSNCTIVSSSKTLS